ncbi:MAG: tetratricopeptide repeat protein [Synergistaceae bacterium]|nr:tetratricopeptide repeat protein [Synergistaceae bacterium]
MHRKIFRAFTLFTVLSLTSSALAASPIVVNGEAHIGDQTVLSVETSQIPAGGSVEWSVNPTTGKTPDRISLRAGGLECAFTPLDTEPIRVIASFTNSRGEVVSTSETLITPKEFEINIAVVVDKPLTLWNAERRSNYVLSPDVLMADTPVKLRAVLEPDFKGEHTLQWTADGATALLSADADDIFIKRTFVGESEIYVSAFNSSGTKLGSGESTVSITLPVSTFVESSNNREAWQGWQRAQELWESKNYSEAVELANRAATLSPRDAEIADGLRAMMTNYTRFTRAQKLREDALNFDAEGKFDDALRNLRAAQVIWPLDDSPEKIKAEEMKVNEQRLLQQSANWLRDTASAYDNENMYEEALEYYGKSLAVMSSDAVADRMDKIQKRLELIADADRYAGEGSTLEREGKLQDALNHYTASVMSNPDATLRQHIEELQSVISRRERQSNALYREGQDFQRKNRLQEALTRYHESVNVWENENARQRIQQLSRNRGLAPDPDLRGPEDFGIGTRAEAQKFTKEADELYAEGKLDECLELYRKALRIAPNQELQKWAAHIFDIVKERDSAAAANKQIKEANALYRAGKVKEALDLYRQSLTTHKNPEIEEFLKKQVQN